MDLLVVDNFDSFTYMLVDYLRQAGVNCRVVRNNEPLDRLCLRGMDGVVLSPGPGTPLAAGRLSDVIQYYHQRVPMLGVCLGHQALGEFFGAKLTKAGQPMHGKTSSIRTLTDDLLWSGLPGEFTVTRYHSLLLTDLPDTLVGLAVTDQGELMALRHRTLPIWGVQFHPEAALTEHGLHMLKNWIAFTLLSSRKANTSSLTVEYL
ncbi:aminodeoxychorismate/anthranilate synthase component II [Spirosoma knui]